MTSPSRVLRPYILRQWRALTGAGLATGVLAAAELAKPWPLALIVDHVLEQRTGAVRADRRRPARGPARSAG